MSWIEVAKRAAVLKALDEIEDKQVVGIGSGTTLELLVLELAAAIKRKGLALELIPTSKQIEAAMTRAHLATVSPNEVSEIDIAIDGADQVASHTLDLIKGGGASLTREKIVDTAAKKLIIVVDERKLAGKFGTNQPVPVEVIPFAQRIVTSRLAGLGGKPTLRRSKNTEPVITDNGNFVIDVDFGLIKDPRALETKLKSVSGIVETGLFLGMTDRVYVGLRDGSVQVLEPK